jgi:F0F1-type ATP synthase gamma subunit
MPEVKSYLERMGNRQRQQAIQSNVTNILGGIE